MVVKRTDSTLVLADGQTAFTQVQIMNAIKAAFAAAEIGNAPFDEYTSGTDRFLIYELVLAPGKSFGTVYLQIRLTAILGLTQRLFTSWNTSTRVGANPGTETSNHPLVNNVPIEFMGLTRNPEFKLVMLYQSNLIPNALGFIRPEFKPAWWDENSFPYCMIYNYSTSFQNWQLAGVTPFSGGVSTGTRIQANFGATQMALPNPLTVRRDMVSGMLFMAGSAEGLAGRTSDDLVMVSSTGLQRKDIIQVTPGVEEYVLLLSGTPGLPAMRVI